MRTATRAVSNSYYLSLDWVAQTVMGYLFWIILVKMLAPNQVGIFSTVINFALFIVAFSPLGLNGAATKLLSEYQAKGQLEHIKSTVLYTLKISLLANLVIAAFLVMTAPQLASLLHISELELCLSAVTLVAFYFVFLTGIYMFSLQKMKTYFLTNLAFNSLKILISVLLISAGFSYFGALLGIILSALIVSLYRFRWIPIGGATVEKSRVWQYAIPGVMGAVGGILLNQSGIISLSILANATAVGVFTIAFTFSSPLRIITQNIGSAIAPITSQQWALEEKTTLNSTTSRALKYSCLLTLPMALGLIFFSREFLLLFTSAEYLSGALTFQLLVVAYFLIGISSILLNTLYFTGKPKTNRNINIVGGGCSILLSFLLIPVFGIEGAALAFLAAGLVMFFSSLYYSHKHLKFSLMKVQMAKNVLAAVLFALVLCIFGQFDKSVLLLGAAIAVASVVYVLSLLYLRFFDKIDVRILEELENKLPWKLKFLAVISKNILKGFV